MGQSRLASLEMTINVLTVTDADNPDNECRGLGRVNNPVIANSDAIVVLFASYLLESQYFRKRIYAQNLQGMINP